MSEKPKRRWYQFSLKMLLVGMTLAAFLLSLFGRSLSLSRQAAFHREKVKDIRVTNDDGGSDSIYPLGTWERYHVDAARAYAIAAIQPWMPVRLPAEPQGESEEEYLKARAERNERSEARQRERWEARQRKSLPNSEAPAPNPPDP